MLIWIAGAHAGNEGCGIVDVVDRGIAAKMHVGGKGGIATSKHEDSRIAVGDKLVKQLPIFATIERDHFVSKSQAKQKKGRVEQARGNAYFKSSYYQTHREKR